MLTHTRNIARILIVDGSHVLLAKVIKKGFYFLPGGGIEYNEPLATAARRELSEELDISDERVRSLRPIGVYEHTWDDNGSPFHELNLVCRCEIEGLTSAIPVSSIEQHLAFEWVPISGLSAIDLRPDAFKALIPTWLSRAGDLPFFASSMAT